MARTSSGIFINCPFDTTYKPIFDALLFTIYSLGFIPRCSLEVDDSSEHRFSRIERIIEECRFAVHDISNVRLDPTSNLPRFNMPLELGMFLGCKRFGGTKHKKKACIILDTERYRFQQFISDIAGQDIHPHGDNIENAVTEVRNWLSNISKRKARPGGPYIVDR